MPVFARVRPPRDEQTLLAHEVSEPEVGGGVSREVRATCRTLARPMYSMYGPDRRPLPWSTHRHLACVSMRTPVGGCFVRW